MRPVVCQPRARKRERVGGREFGERAAGDIAIAAIGVVVDERRHALALGVAAAEAELELLAGRQRRVAKHLLRGIAAERRARACAVFRRAAREQLDHAADGIGAIQRRARALDDFDALERFGRDVLQRGAADGAGIDAHAVDEHHGVVAFRAAREQRGGLPGAAIARDFEAGMGLQQFADVAGERSFDVAARDDDDRRADRIERHRCAGGGDDGFIEIVLREARS